MGKHKKWYMVNLYSILAPTYMYVLFYCCPSLVISYHGHHPSLLLDQRSYTCLSYSCTSRRWTIFLEYSSCTSRARLILSINSSWITRWWLTCSATSTELPCQVLHPRHPPHALKHQGTFHWHPTCTGHQGFISHHPNNFALEYFRPLIDLENNNNISPYQQNWMFSEWVDTDHIIAHSQNMRPPGSSTPGRV